MVTRPKFAILARRLYVDHIFRPVFSNFPAHAPFFCLFGIRATQYGGLLRYVFIWFPTSYNNGFF